jgi:UPF0176 protein
MSEQTLISTMEELYHILLYYCYTEIEDPIAFRNDHHRLCADLGLLGRIIIAPEGINGTVSGLVAACHSYREQLKADPRFAYLHFKVDTYPTHAFQKLQVRVKKEIVHADLPTINPTQRAGAYISGKELEKLKDNPDVVLLDVRSNYEHKIGKFKDAITLDIAHFREFKDQVHQLAPYKDKKVITYCTGGIKCEKASAYLLEQGFSNVYQLHGGIIQYGKDTAGAAFEGKCYVFDNRLLTTINQANSSTTGCCYACHTPCDRMVNCANPLCNRHAPLCKECAEKLAGSCSATCQAHPAKRPYDGTGYYVKKLNGYNPYKGIRRKA